MHTLVRSYLLEFLEICESQLAAINGDVPLQLFGGNHTTAQLFFPRHVGETVSRRKKTKGGFVVSVRVFHPFKASRAPNVDVLSNPQTLSVVPHTISAIHS